MIFISRNMIFVLCDHVFWFLSIVQSDHCLSFPVLFILFIALYCRRDTEVVICIILAIRKRTDGLIYYSSIRHYRWTSDTMIGKQWSTLNQNTIANTIYCQGFDISGKTFWKTRFDDSLKILKFLTY